MKIKEVLKKVKGLVRSSRLFAKGKESKTKVAKKLLCTINDVHSSIHGAVHSGRKLRSKAGRELARLTDIMDTLFPQIWYFTETGCVAAKKIIHLQMEQLYAIVRGKAGKKVEFGLKWGISRLGGGYIAGFLMNGGQHLSDKKFCIESVKNHKQYFEKPPKIFGFDRGGYSNANIKRAKKLGVKYVGIAPKGQTPWSVSKAKKRFITRERVQVEGSIGNIKKPVYGFNKPDARSIPAMATYGHRAILGFNIRKLAKDQLIAASAIT